MASLKRNFIYNTTYQMVRIVSPLLTVPYLSRTLGPDQVGVYSYTYSITNYFVLFATLGMSTYGVRAIATAKDDRDKRSHIFWSAYLSQVSISMIVLFVYILYALTLPQGGWLLCLSWGMWVLSAGVDISWLMFGVEDFKATTIRSVLVKVLELALIFLFVNRPEDLLCYICIVSGGYFVSQIVLWPFVSRYVDIVRPTWQEIREHYKPNLKLFIPVVAISLYTTLDKILLGLLSSMTETGYYEYSEKVSKVPMALITALGTVMLPRMSAVFSSGDSKAGKELIETCMWFMQVGAIAMAFGVAAIAPELAPVFLGSEFTACGPVMALLGMIIPLITGSNVIGRQYLIPTFHDNQYTLSVLIGAVINVITIVFLAPMLGAFGAAIATVLAEMSVLVAQAWLARDELPILRYITNSIPFLFIGIIMLISVRLCSNALISIFDVSPKCLLLEISVGATIYTLLIVLYCLMTQNKFFLAILRSNNHS